MRKGGRSALGELRGEKLVVVGEGVGEVDGWERVDG